MTSIREEFRAADGSLENYSTYDIAKTSQLDKQRHIDIRTFDPAITSPFTMDDFSTLTLAELDALTLDQIEALTVTIADGENWTAGTVGVQTDRNYWSGLSLSCAAGANTTASVTDPVDLDTGFDDNDFISVALPAFPLANINLGSSYIRFTSNADGDFSAAGENVAVAFNSPNLVSSLASGDTELRFKRQYINSIDLGKVTGVRFEITATGSCTFRVLAIRLFDKNWVYAPVDTNTRRHRLVKPVTLNGSATITSAFPSNDLGPSFQRYWPILFRSGTPLGDGDPYLVDASLGVPFYTGHSAVGTNSIGLYLREQPYAPVYSLDLDTDGSTNVKQETLDALGHQPDYQPFTYPGRQQQELDIEIQETLDGATQAALERSNTSPIYSDYIEVRLSWGVSGASLVIQDVAGSANYTFTPTLAANTYYFLLAELEDRRLRVRVLAGDQYGSIDWNTVVYDTGTIFDPQLFNRRPGRFGWWAQLAEGNAFIEEVQTRSLSFGDYVSNPQGSLTPVIGVQLAADMNAPVEQIGVLGTGPYGGLVDIDPERFHLGEGYRVTTSGTPLQGAASNYFYVNDWANLVLSLDIMCPFTESNLTIYLENETRRRINVSVPPITPNHWETLHLRSKNWETYPTGRWRLVVLQNDATASRWWISSPSAKNRMVEFLARPHDRGPWGDNIATWIPAREAINSGTAAILFPERGRGLQWKARVLQQDAQVAKIDAKPIYAELGRIQVAAGETINDIRPFYGENELDFSWSPTLSNLSFTIDGITYTPTAPRVAVNTAITFTAVAVAPPLSGRSFVRYEWDFGDGSTATGNGVTHTFTVANQTLRVSCCVTDNEGTRICVGHQVYVTNPSTLLPALSVLPSPSLVPQP